MNFQEAINAASTNRQVVWDKDDRGVRGLKLRVNGDGSKSFMVYYRTRDRKERSPKIGEYPEISLGEARRRAKLILGLVAAGKDPKGQWDETKAEPTIQELYEYTVREYWKKDVTKKRREDVGYLYKNQIAATFSGKRISEVTPKLIREWHAKLSSTPRNANMALAVLSKIFQFAMEREEIPQIPNPCLLVKPYPSKRRKRYATPEELAKIYAALEEEQAKNPHAVAFILMLMFSGSRPMAIARATWDQLRCIEMNGEVHGILEFHGKSTYETGELEKIVFPPIVMRAVLQLPRVSGATITGLHGVPRKLWKRVREKTGCPDLWARDLRRSYGVHGLSNGVSLDQIRGLLNHRNVQTTMGYTDLLDQERIKKALAVSSVIESIVSK